MGEQIGYSAIHSATCQLHRHRPGLISPHPEFLVYRKSRSLSHSYGGCRSPQLLGRRETLNSPVSVFPGN